MPARPHPGSRFVFDLARSQSGVEARVLAGSSLLFLSLLLVGCRDEAKPAMPTPGDTGLPSQDSAIPPEDSGAAPIDADGDGYPEGEDCDDSRADVNPGAEERCDPDDVDEDCDGLADEADPDLVDGQNWYQDIDGDGYGDAADPGIRACEEPSGLIEDDTDCDDAHAEVYPGAPEICEDGLVNDCAGAGGECGWSGSFTDADADAVFNDGSSFSVVRSVDGSGDLDGDGVPDLAMGTPTRDFAERDQGAIYVERGPISSGAHIPGGDRVLQGATSYAWLGVQIAVLGDVDGDGYDDLLAGANGQDLAAGSAWLIHGPISSGSVDSQGDAVLAGKGPNDALGTAVSRAGDLDGDGLPDLLVGASGAGEGGAGRGAVYLLSGLVSGEVTPALDSLATVAASDLGDAVGRGDNLGPVGDLNGDGVEDLALGNPYDETGGVQAGACYLFYGPISGTRLTDDADQLLVGPDLYSGLGSTVEGSFDLDGDGLDDLALSSPWESGSVNLGGAVYLIVGPATASGLGGAQTTIRGLESEVVVGSIAVGDTDGDGQVDLLLGSGTSLSNGSSSITAVGLGGAWLFRSPGAGTFDTTSADAAFTGGSSTFGLEVALLGDQDGNGTAELVIVDSPARTTRGDSMYLFRSPGF